MRNVCHEMVHTLAQQDERVVFIGSDLSPGLLAEMKAEFPKRHYMEGVTEQAIVGVAAGMARDGLIPYANTITPFFVRRALEQIAIDCCEQDLPVRLIGNGGGLIYAHLGPTHISFDDIALMRVLPRMTIVAPLNDHEMRTFMRSSLNWPHPIYIRLSRSWEGKVELPVNFNIGQAVTLLWGVTRPVLIVSTGVVSGRAYDAARILEREGIFCTVLHYPTIKPFDVFALTDNAQNARMVVVVEEHSIIGGLGSAVLYYLNVHRIHVPVTQIGIPDVFPKSYGTQETQLTEFGLQPDQIVATIKADLQ